MAHDDEPAIDHYGSPGDRIRRSVIRNLDELGIDPAKVDRAAALARVEALAEQWEDWPIFDPPGRPVMRRCARLLRAALDG